MSSPADEVSRDRRGTYIAVLLVEVVVITALWAFSAWFGG